MAVQDWKSSPQLALVDLWQGCADIGDEGFVAPRGGQPGSGADHPGDCSISDRWRRVHEFNIRNRSVLFKHYVFFDEKQE